MADNFRNTSRVLEAFGEMVREGLRRGKNGVPEIPAEISATVMVGGVKSVVRLSLLKYRRMLENRGMPGGFHILGNIRYWLRLEKLTPVPGGGKGLPVPKPLPHHNGHRPFFGMAFEEACARFEAAVVRALKQDLA